MAAIVEIQGPAHSRHTDALRVLAPDARLVVQDEVGVVLADGHRVGPFESVIELVGADRGLVAAASESDLKRIDQHLLSRTFMTRNTLSATDRVVLGLLHSFIAGMADADLYQFCCVARWFDHVQWAVPALAHVAIKTDRDNRVAKSDKKAKKAMPTNDKAAVPVQNSAIQDAASLDIRIGRIIHVEGHPSDPGLYVEQIDMGESTGPRQIVSGLAKFIPLSEMLGRYVCVLVNIGACEIKGVPSSGLVLCASNADRTQVEPVRPADGVAPGDRIVFPGVPARAGPIETLKPKRMQKLLKLLVTSSDPEPYALCAGLPLMTERGRIYSSPSLRDCPIK